MILIPKQFDEILAGVKESLSGKKNPRTKKPYTEDDMYAIAVAQYKEKFGKAPSQKKSDDDGFAKFDYAFTISKVDAEGRFIEGYASVETLDSQDEIISKEALAEALDSYMANPIIRYMHQPQPIGKAVEARVDSKGLWIKAYISKNTKIAKEAWGLIEEGILKSFSIGGKLVKFVDYYDKLMNKNVRKITKMALKEISVVDIPANPESFFSVAKRLMEENSMESVEEITVNKDEHGMESEMASESKMVVKPSEDGSCPEGYTKMHDMCVSNSHLEEMKSMMESEKSESPVEVAKVEVAEVAAPIVEKQEQPKEEIVTVTKAEFEALQKQVEELKKNEEIESRIDKIISEKFSKLNPESKAVVSVEKNESENAKAKLAKMSDGELAALVWSKQ